MTNDTFNWRELLCKKYYFLENVLLVLIVRRDGVYDFLSVKKLRKLPADLPSSRLYNRPYLVKSRRLRTSTVPTDVSIWLFGW